MTDETHHFEFCDTHAHLSDEQFLEDRQSVIARAADAGTTRIVNVSFSPTMWDEAINLSSAHPGIAYSLGVHPNSAGEWSEKIAIELERRIDEQRPAAVGETGLDYHWNTFAREIQIAAFGHQVEMALAAELPVIIHMRGDVEADIRTMLAGSNTPICVFHSFDGTPELADWIISKGWYVGAGGLMTRRSARGLQEILKSAPLEQILLETDSPYLAPTGWPEKRNSPESIPIVASHLARIRETDIEEIAQVTTANAIRVFDLDRETRSLSGRQAGTAPAL